jgi:arginyl-tRNA synthetase
MEPFLTWNLFLTLFLVPASVSILGIWLSWRLKRGDEKDKEIAHLIAKLDAEKQKATYEWREHHTAILCRVKQTVEGIDSRLDRKVNKEDCIRNTDDTWKAINELRKT